jgi:meiotically up-regulated gene 157 (Mug157) protein
MTSDQLFKIVEQYSRKSEAGYGDIKVTRVADQKTVFVEQIDGVGRAIMMDKYQVDGAIYWAGYSSRSETVYISLAA